MPYKNVKFAADSFGLGLRFRLSNGQKWKKKIHKKKKNQIASLILKHDDQIF